VRLAALFERLHKQLILTRPASLLPEYPRLSSHRHATAQLKPAGWVLLQLVCTPASTAPLALAEFRATHAVGLRVLQPAGCTSCRGKVDLLISRGSATTGYRATP